MPLFSWARIRVFATLIAFCSAAPTQAEQWMFLEVRGIPNDCKNPISCLGKSSLLLRNMLNMPRDERDKFLRFLNSVSTIRAVEDSAVESYVMEQGAGALHDLPVAEKLVPLINHPGVYFDSKKLDDDDDTADFSEYVRSELQKAGLKLLAKDEMLTTPGRPRLTVRYSKRTESEGCIIPFSISVSIREEVVLARNPGIKIETNTWSGLQRENLANTNYTVRSALRDAIEKLVKDYKTANNL